MQSKHLRSERHRSPRLPLDERLADEARFIKRWLDNPKATGAVSPSGRFLARAMASYVDPKSTGPIIELGPGTGPVTEALLERGIAQEQLILVEYDPSFCKLLARRFPKARIVQGDAYRLAHTLRPILAEPAACVVSSLPLLTRPERGRLALLREAFDLMQPDGSFRSVHLCAGFADPADEPPQRPTFSRRGVAFRVAQPAARPRVGLSRRRGGDADRRSAPKSGSLARAPEAACTREEPRIAARIRSSVRGAIAAARRAKTRACTCVAPPAWRWRQG